MNNQAPFPTRDYYYKQIRSRIYYFDSYGFPCKISKSFIEKLKKLGKLKNWDSRKREGDSC